VLEDEMVRGYCTTQEPKPGPRSWPI